MNKNQNQKNEKGSSMIEIVIALFLLSTAIGFSVILFWSGQKILTDRENEFTARVLSKEGIVGVKSVLENNWKSTPDGIYGLSFTNGKWELLGDQDENDIFTRKIQITTINKDEKTIKSVVDWESESHKDLEVELLSIVSDWFDVSATGGDTGGTGLAGDWLHPQTLGSVDLGAGNSATDLDVVNKIVYLSTEASDNKKADFYIVDATNGNSPFIVSSVNTGTGLNAVDVARNYAYVANKSTSNQLQIIDVSNINSPTLYASFHLIGVSGSGAVGNSIFYDSQKIYIGTNQANGPEFHIIDVSIPSNPQELGSYEINGDVNAIIVKDNIAYLSLSNDDKELKILDVNNPASITTINDFDANGNTEDGKSLCLVFPKLYLGRTVGGNHVDHHELYTLDISTPTNPLTIESKNFNSSINDLFIKDYLMFLATDDPNNEFQVWNITDPINPTLWSSFNFPQVASGIDYEDNVIYVSVRSNDSLRIITSQ
ncbi:MAG: hypothetical protein WDK96_02060 [Candidatus Paceibacterota bacterium]|jgi:hypothetical protein